MKRWWTSRWVIVPGTMFIAVTAWNLYVSAHDGGTVEGRVVDAAGQGVAGATVLLYERSFITNNEKQRTISGTDGLFRFQGNESHALQLQAEAAGARSERVTVRLWFRAQDARLAEPLRLAARAP